jgi:hypothetical protein
MSRVPTIGINVPFSSSMRLIHSPRSRGVGAVQNNVPSYQVPNYQQGTANSNGNTNDQDDQDDVIDPQQLAAINAILPSSEQVRANPLIQKIIQEQFNNIYSEDAPDCISSSAKEIDKNDPTANRLITALKTDLIDEQKHLENVHVAYDPVSRMYFEIVDKRDDRNLHNLNYNGLAQLIVAAGKIHKYQWSKVYIDGVQLHERFHEALLRAIPDVMIESFNEGVRIELTGTTTNLGFDIITFGESAFYPNAIYDKVDQNEDLFYQSQEGFSKAMKNHFVGWNEYSFDKFMDGLKTIVQNLVYLAQEDSTLSLAAVAPLVLKGTIYNQHSVLSNADKLSYKEAIDLKQRILSLIKSVQAFAEKAQAIWESKFGVSKKIKKGKTNIVSYNSQANVPNYPSQLAGLTTNS